MVPTAIREDPLTQYLLGFSFVILVVGSVGAIAQVVHMSELPSLTYTVTILVLAFAFIAATALYHRLFYTPDDSQRATAEQQEEQATEPAREASPEQPEFVEEESAPESSQVPDEAEANPD